MSVGLDQKIISDDVLALFALANQKPRFLQGQPYQIFTTDARNPVVTDRGGWDATVHYSRYDAVTQDGRKFIATSNNFNDPPVFIDTDGFKSASLNWAQDWLSCYNRLRSALQIAVNNGLYTGTGRELIFPWQLSVSGGLTDDGYTGWPCQSPSSLYNDLWFYFADTGGTVSVTASAAVTNGSYTWFRTDKCRAYNAVYYNGGQPPDSSVPALSGITPTAFPVSLLSEIMIGGNQAVTVSGTFTIAAQLFQGGTYSSSGVLITSDGTDPAALASVDASAFLPGAVFTKATVGASVIFTCTYSGTVNPGRYGVTITGAVGGDDYYYGFSGGWVSPSRALLLQGSFYAGLSASGTISVTNSTAVTTNGIHGTKAVKKIRLPYFNATTGLPFGCFWVSAATTETDNLYGDSYSYSYPGPYRVWRWQFDPFPQPTFDGYALVGPTDTTFTATTTGYWFGQTPPINSGGMDGLNQYMQWNHFHVNAAGNVDSTTPIPYTGGHSVIGSTAQQAYNVAAAEWERQLMPCQWVALTYYTKGFQIQDSNGNLQTVTLAGRSGSTAPNWATSLLGVTVEPDYHGVGTQNGVQWQLTAAPRPIPAPATAKRFSLARYPFAWYNDLTISDAALKARMVPDMTQVGYTTGTLLANKSVAGWWIYRVYIHRFGQANAQGAIVNPGAPAYPPIPITIGCMRSGSFVSFGTFNTGDIVNAMWPVFTNDALVYQCAERVDIQATILTCGLGYSTWGNAGYPIMRAYWQDLTTILNLIPNALSFNATSGFNSGSGF